MLLTEKINMRWNSRNKTRYISLGYIYTKIGSYFDLNIKDISIGSKYEVDVKCDICGSIYKTNYKSYYKSHTNHNFDSCEKCVHEKTKLTNIEKYGVSDVIQVKEIRDKMKNTCLKRYGKEFYTDTNKFKSTMKGKNNPRYIDGRTKNNPIRKSKPEEIRWRKEVYKRDKYVCQICGYNKGHILNAHHLNSYSWAIDERYDINNGITLCIHCHKEFHKKYGKLHNTRNQFEEFKKIKQKGQTTIP